MPQIRYKILIIDDDETVLFGYRRSLTKSGYSISEASSLRNAKQILAENDFNALLLDLQLPDGNSLEWIPEIKETYSELPIIVVTGSGDVPTAVKAMKSGAENFLVKPVETDNLEMALRTALELSDLRKQNRIKQRLNKAVEPFFGASRAIADLEKSLKVAVANNTVALLLGETGTGKGVLAKWIHEHGDRSSGAFVELNCSCLRGDLLKSELFGHTRGAFTSAISDREGLIEMADGGTLFLDEIGDMDLSVQAQFLKTIEERTYRRVGDNRLRKSDFRLICATNKDLLKETEIGAFRKDLYYRICVFPITVPPLRDRPEDIEGLSEYFIAEFGHSDSTLSREVLDMLKTYQWPGNIRELRNMVERAVLLAQNGPITPQCFPGLDLMSIIPKAEERPPTEKPVDLHNVEREFILKTVKACNGDKKRASKILGISSATIYRKIGSVKDFEG